MVVFEDWNFAPYFAGEVESPGDLLLTPPAAANS